MMNLKKIYSNGDMNELAIKYIDALGGYDNIVSVDNCVTRLRLELRTME